MRYRLVITSHWVSTTLGKHSAMIRLVVRLAVEDQQIRVAAAIDQMCDFATLRKCMATWRKNRQSFGVASFLHQQRLALRLMTSLLVITSAYGAAGAAVNVAGNECLVCTSHSIPPPAPSTHVRVHRCNATPVLYFPQFSVWIFTVKSSCQNVCSSHIVIHGYMSAQTIGTHKFTF